VRGTLDAMLEGRSGDEAPAAGEGREVVAEPSELERAARDRDRALVEAHQNGDSTVFAIIVRDHYPMLLAQAERRLGSRAEAEDAVQEALERAYRVFGRFGGEYRLAAWLSRIVANVCNDHGNRRSAERRLPERIAQRVLPTGDVSDPAALAIVQAAIDALRPSQRDAFLLHEVRGLSYQRLAGQLGISEDNARARVHRAKRALRRSLDQARTGLAALIGVRLGAPALARRIVGPFTAGDPPARPPRSKTLPPGSPAGGMELGASPAPSLPTLPAAASQVAASPIAQVAASVASSGPRGNIVAWLATGLATALTGVLSGPGVATLPAIAAAAVSTASSTTATASTGPPTTVTANTAAVAPSDQPAGAASRAPSTPALPTWIAAAASFVVPAAASASPAVTIQDCPLGYPSRSDSGPLTGSVAAVLSTPVVAGITVPDPTLAAAATLTATGSGGATTPVQLQVNACLPPSGSILTATISGPGADYQLRGTLVRTVVDGADSDYVVRGTAVPQSADAGSAAGLTPGAVAGFVAMLDVRQPGTAASLTVAFFGPVAPTPAGSGSSAGSTPGATTGTGASTPAGTTPSGGATTGAGSSGTGTTPAGGSGGSAPPPESATSATAPPTAGSSP
jgi:RNA polymerase sigma-70 factor (ECF subfamily)